VTQDFQVTACPVMHQRSIRDGRITDAIRLRIRSLKGGMPPCRIERVDSRDNFNRFFEGSVMNVPCFRETFVVVIFREKFRAISPSRGKFVLINPAIYITP